MNKHWGLLGVSVLMVCLRATEPTQAVVKGDARQALRAIKESVERNDAQRAASGGAWASLFMELIKLLNLDEVNFQLEQAVLENPCMSREEYTEVRRGLLEKNHVKVMEVLAALRRQMDLTVKGLESMPGLTQELVRIMLTEEFVEIMLAAVGSECFVV